MQPNYKLVLVIEFLDGNEEYIIWEPLFYAQMVEKGVDFNKLFFSPEFIPTPPLNVHLYLYNNPQVKNIGHRIGDNEVSRQILIGTKICYIKTF